MGTPTPVPEVQIQHWHALLDSAGEGIWGLDLDGNCTFVNRMAINAFGFEREEMLGNNMHDLVHHHRPDGTEFPGSECPIYAVVKKNEAFRQMTDTMFRKDGSFFIAEVSAQPVTVHDQVVGVVVTFREISELRRQQEEMRQAYKLAEQKTAELDAVIESIPHAVYIATQSGELRFNQIAKKMGGGKFPRELKTLERALAGESSTQTLHNDGRWIRSVAAPVLLDGKIRGGVAVNTDITQTRLQDDALRKSEKLAAVGQLASSIAHEINNPLESITNLLYLIQQSQSMQDVQQYAKLAQAELARVTQITVQTLRFHRQNSKPVEVDLAEMLRAVMSLYTGRMLVRTITADVQLTSAPRVTALEGEIRQVANNLIRNALDAMSTGGRLMVRLHPQRDPHTDAPGVRITVADTGEGISPKIIAHLFEPFQTTKEQTGTGLGLWVSKGIVEKHGGRISHRSRRGRGTVFAVWMPVQPEANLATQVA
ncbi:MAG: ATP-binding protein [Acidobacteriota bacterium]|nr:ATP-binding protein [Acidobacteriota bacterium]